MKGIVFTEFMNLVESKFGLKTADEIITHSDLESKGAYTSVGTYDYKEMLSLVSHLSSKTKLAKSILIKTFGEHLLNFFSIRYSNFFENKNTFEILKTLDNHIHVEVKKLYPKADLPKFSYEQNSEDVLTVIYKSNKPFADLAEGLISACVKHFNENIHISTEDLGNCDGTNRKFILTKVEKNG